MNQKVESGKRGTGGSDGKMGNVDRCLVTALRRHLYRNAASNKNCSIGKLIGSGIKQVVTMLNDAQDLWKIALSSGYSELFLPF